MAVRWTTWQLGLMSVLCSSWISHEHNPEHAMNKSQKNAKADILFPEYDLSADEKTYVICGRLIICNSDNMSVGESRTAKIHLPEGEILEVAVQKKTPQT
ncbi:MAG: hypothetical protein PHC53_05250 [Patescibacteria group bacterium]|nr:hypothetical protein [Patescibacteria group bacterium]